MTGTQSATHLKTGTPVARGLNILLIIAMVILVVAIVVMLVPILFPGGFRDDFIRQAQENGLPASEQNYVILCLGSAIGATAYLGVVHILRSIVKTLIAGDPFVPENISRLRAIWIILAGAELFRMAVHMFAITTPSQETIIDINITAWFLVFVIAALAEVFRHGAELRRDQELTV